MKFNKIHYLKLFDMISSIRICEELIHKYYNQNEMKTPMHMSRGEELVVSAAVKSFNRVGKKFLISFIKITRTVKIYYI